MRRRIVTAEEARLWRAVTRTVTPYRAEAPEEPLPPAESLSASTPPPAPVSAQPPARPNGVDGHTMRRLTRGQRAIDASIDLHGMTLDRAHVALRRFVEIQAAAGSRCLLVVTGKGSPGRPGLLRREVPLWLSGWSPPVLTTASATPRHGGEGALYVLLQRRR